MGMEDGEDGEDSAAGPSQNTYLTELSAETSAERNLQLATLSKRKQGSQSTIEAKREHERVQKNKAHITTILYWAPTKPTVHNF